MPFVIEEVVEIAAPRSIVWDVITDLAAYPQWNPFVVACRSSLVVGEPIDMRVRLIGRFAQPQRETILEHHPGERLCYGLPRSMAGGLMSWRCHDVQDLGANRTRYRSYFELSGWLAPLVRFLLRRPLTRGFRSMTAALKQRAEHLAVERGRMPVPPSPGNEFPG